MWDTLRDVPIAHALRNLPSPIAFGQSLTREAGNRVRTDDLLITNQLLYQLSYAGRDARSVAQRAGPDKRTAMNGSGRPP